MNTHTEHTEPPGHSPEGAGPVVDSAGNSADHCGEDTGLGTSPPSDTDTDSALAPDVELDVEAAHDVVVEPARDVVPGRVVGRRDRPAREILPGWAKDRASAVSAARWAGGYGSHVAVFHTVRLPVYGARLAGRAPLGVGRGCVLVCRWVVDTENRDVRHALGLQVTDANAYLRLVADRRRQTRHRATVVAAVAVVLLGVAAYSATAPALVQVALALVLLTVAGVMGTTKEARVTGRAMDTAQVPPLTADTITEALTALGLGSINSAHKADPKAIRFLSIVRDGAGFRADIDLPGGATAGEVIDRRSKLASGLRRPMGQVWPEAAPEVHEGRLILYIADKSLSEGKPTPWPLAKTGAVNVFNPVPIGTDQRGRPVTVTLLFASGLIGAIPRMGKTFTLRLLLLAAALDPRVQIFAYNLKGGSDLDALEQVAHAYHSGEEPADMDAMLRDLQSLKVEMRRRYAVLRTLPKDQCPESKVTDALASDRTLGLHPILVAFDETQVMFEHPSYGAQYDEIVTDLVKRGPAVGIMVWLATQRPDAKSIPTGISANAVLRLCLKVMGQTENDMVLGTSSYKNGVRATMLGRKDLGIAILAGEGDDPVIVKGAYVDTPTAEKIAARARTTRLAQHRLTGLAAGEHADPDEDTGSVLDHLLAVWPETEPRLWCDTLATRLATDRPAFYDGWTGTQITAAVNPHGVRTVQIKRLHQGQMRNRRGLDRAAVVHALTVPETPNGGGSG